MPTVIAQASGQAGIAQTLRTMRQLAMAASIDPVIRRQAARATAHCDRADITCQCASLLAWVKRKLRFVADPSTAEALHDPRMMARAIEQGKDVYGDCDDFSMYLAALLMAVGRRPIFRAVGYDGRPYQHVYVVCDGMPLDATRDEWREPMGRGLRQETIGMNLDLANGQMSLGGIDIGNMFKRMFKFTPKSFTYSNITRSIYRLTPISWVGQVVAPKLERKVYKAAPVLVPAVVGGTLAVAYGPQIYSVLAPKLASLGGLASKAGQTLMSFIGQLPGKQQAQAAQAITTEQAQAVAETGQIPPDLQQMLSQLASQAQPPPPPYQTMAASGYAQPGMADPSFGLPSAPAPTQTGIFGDPTVAVWVLLGVSAVVVLMQPGGRR